MKEAREKKEKKLECAYDLTDEILCRMKYGGIRQKEIARVLDMTVGAVGKKLRYETDFSLDEAIAVGKLAGFEVILREKAPSKSVKKKAEEGKE